MIEMRLDSSQFDDVRERLSGPALDDTVRDISLTLRQLVRGRTPVGIIDGGTMKESWTQVHRMGSLGGEYAFWSSVTYSDVLEYGGYPGVGPRTVQAEGGIFSRQAVGGMITPILENPATLTSVKALLVRRMRELIRA